MMRQIRKRYSVPAKRGMVVAAHGMIGRITSSLYNNLRIGIPMGGGKTSLIACPTRDIAYLVDGEWIMYDASPITIGATEFYDTVVTREKK